MSSPTGPSLWRLVALLLGLRARTMIRTRAGAIGGALLLLVGLALALASGWATHAVFDLITQSPARAVWLPFTASLLCFLLALFWVVWPVIAAQISEVNELGRYLLCPIRPRRLYLAQSLIAAFEPANTIFYPPLLGMTWALSDAIAIAPWRAALAMLAFALMNITCGRALQYALLNMMASRRSTEMLSTSLLGALALSILLPPVDASWLFSRIGAFGSAEDLRIIESATATLIRTPPGWLANALLFDDKSALLSGGMLLLAAAGFGVGLTLLERFYRGGRGMRRRRRTAKPWRARPPRALFSALLLRELRSIANNPKARLLFCVPFFLAIILKVIGGSQLFSFLWGERWAAMLLALFAAYCLSVLAGQFFSNAYGYDGPGLRLLLLAPIAPWRWIVARNLALAIFAAAQFVGLATVVLVAMPQTTFLGLSLPLAAFGLGLPVSLGVGNLLSLRFPRRFDHRLARRDRPVAASVLISTLALTLCAALIAALRPALEKGAIWAPALALFAGLLVYGLSVPRAATAIASRREALVEAIARR